MNMRLGRYTITHEPGVGSITKVCRGDEVLAYLVLLKVQRPSIHTMYSWGNLARLTPTYKRRRRAFLCASALLVWPMFVSIAWLMLSGILTAMIYPLAFLSVFGWVGKMG